MQRRSLDLRSTARFTPLVLDYLAQAPALRGLYRYTPDRAGVADAVREREFPLGTRKVLVEALGRQYAGIQVHAAVRKNLELLAGPNSVTVTTGHQLCLFTGPLYVPLKIMNVVRLARELSTAERPVVPVFWAATEDHDRPEIDHAYVAGKAVRWSGGSAGAVGRLPLTGIGPAVEEACALLGQGSRANELCALLRDAYRPERSLAAATRIFVNALFGAYGVVVVDGDDPALKRLFIPTMRAELLEGKAEKAVAAAVEVLGSEQAHARPINLFHLTEGARERIERSGNGYTLRPAGSVVNEAALLTELEAHPEHFSPNVLLRPLYQETILPNAVYVGGGGELAYWLQLKGVFEAYGVPMPALLLRTSAGILRAKDAARMEALGLSLADLFRPHYEQQAAIALDNASFSTDLSAEQVELEAFYGRLADRLAAADPTLRGAAEARAAAARKGLDKLGLKLVRAAKREQQELLDDLQLVLQQLFPHGGLQERRENLMPWYVQQGPAFLDVLLNELDPLAADFTLLVGE